MFGPKVILCILPLSLQSRDESTNATTPLGLTVQAFLGTHIDLLVKGRLAVCPITLIQPGDTLASFCCSLSRVGATALTAMLTPIPKMASGVHHLWLFRVRGKAIPECTSTFLCHRRLVQLCDVGLCTYQQPANLLQKGTACATGISPVIAKVVLTNLVLSCFSDVILFIRVLVFSKLASRSPQYRPELYRTITLYPIQNLSGE
ncbi:hypothetical protein B0H34DRAFT_731119 [Crassisporium funariophilum]|nr:hypothetical protein B0H34DRAFT_731119 [Crassisporium funariophilum]